MSLPDAWQRRAVPIGGTDPCDFLRNPQRRARTWIERWIVARGAAISSLLDVPCNAGIEAFRLRRAGWTGAYAGADLNGKAIAAARRGLASLGGLAFTRADARALPFPDRAFDAVLVKDLLEHLDGYRPALDEACRVACEWLILSFFIPLGRTERRARHPDGYWLNRYARGPFLEALGECGFRVGRRKVVWRAWARDEVLVARRSTRPPRDISRSCRMARADIVRFDRIRQFNAVNLGRGYAILDIRSPLEVIEYGE